MKIKFIFLLLLVVNLLSGCATPRQMTRQEWIDATERTYQNVTTEQILLAAEKLFRLADGNDFTITHSRNGIYATRKWLVYIIIATVSGTDHWRILVSDESGSKRVSVEVSTQSQSTTLQPVIGAQTTSQYGAWSVGTTSLAGAPISGTALYDVFWARMDYLLGKRSDWMDCAEAKVRRKQNITWGSNEPLCLSVTVKDDRPDGQAKAQPEKNCGSAHIPGDC